MTHIADAEPPRSEFNRGVVDYRRLAREILEALEWVSMSVYERDALNEDLRYWNELLRP